MTAKDAATCLGVPYSTFLLWIQSGKVQPTLRAGTRYVFSREDVLRLEGLLQGAGRQAIHAGRARAA